MVRCCSFLWVDVWTLDQPLPGDSDMDAPSIPAPRLNSYPFNSCSPGSNHPFRLVAAPLPRLG
jgi:hypothetical protein